MYKKENNFAFIDSQNLNLGVFNDVFDKKGTLIYKGWKIDMRRFRIYLKEKYGVQKAFLFIGYVPGNQRMYSFFQDAGFICVFKPTLELGKEKIKGNVDAELVLHAMIECRNYNKAVIISGDGDFYCLVDYLIQNNKLKKILVLNKYCYSSLLKRLSNEKSQIIDFINSLKVKIEYTKEKSSRRDGTLREPFSS
jgi:uncharacterized LabA/DUF88 family protein